MWRLKSLTSLGTISLKASNMDSTSPSPAAVFFWHIMHTQSELNFLQSLRGSRFGRRALVVA